MRRKNDRVEMCSGPLLINILRFSVPVMLTALFQQLYNAADTIVVGRYAGESALAAVGNAGSVTSLILNLFLGLSSGVSVVLGRALGAKDDKAVGTVVHTAISVSIWAGALVSVLGILLAKPLLRLIDVPEAVMPQALTYLRIVFAGKIPALVYNFGSAILRAKGDAKRPLYIVTISGIINVGLNLLFVVVLKMKADGVALATVLSELFSAVAVVFLLCSSTDNTKLSLKHIRTDSLQLQEIARIGIPSGLQATIFNLANLTVQSGINSFGPAAIAGSAAAGNIGGFLYLMHNSFFQTAIAFVSQNMGAKNYGRIHKIISACVACVTAIWALQVAIVLYAGEALVGIYAPGNEEAIRMGTVRLIVTGCSYGLGGYMEVMSGALRGMGKSFSNMLTSLLGICGVRILWMLLVFPVHRTFEVLFMAFPLSFLCTLLLNTVLVIFAGRRLSSQQAAATLP